MSVIKLLVSKGVVKMEGDNACVAPYVVYSQCSINGSQYRYYAVHSVAAAACWYPLHFHHVYLQTFAPPSSGENPISGYDSGRVFWSLREGR